MSNFLNDPSTPKRSPAFLAFPGRNASLTRNFSSSWKNSLLFLTDSIVFSEMHQIIL